METISFNNEDSTLFIDVEFDSTLNEVIISVLTKESFENSGDFEEKVLIDYVLFILGDGYEVYSINSHGGYIGDEGYTETEYYIGRV